jgi:hypothetical protein
MKTAGCHLFPNVLPEYNSGLRSRLPSWPPAEIERIAGLICWARPSSIAGERATIGPVHVAVSLGEAEGCFGNVGPAGNCWFTTLPSLDRVPVACRACPLEDASSDAKIASRSARNNSESSTVSPGRL